ncbi:hypothetical protein PHMEG_00018500 [Phytophthora megakarya]|uniref:Uncharacterized protein n=1 Tax=Phytophthora megakarya TaxID=4795 RepID=A0A225VVR1_9STRA|nr:hypothetical protein PHMEG_00018500 [Phytophthora megakarya]
MIGDVSGAFGHISVAADHVHMNGFRFDGYIVIDLASTATAIFLPLDSNCLVGNYWCDDHTCLKVDTETRCAEANGALRKTMATVLGPTAINEKIIIECLVWNTVSGTVAVPDDTIAKTQLRIQERLHADKSTLSANNKLLGSLRFVSTSFQPPRAFYQNLQLFATTFPRLHIRHQPPKDVREDLRWYLAQGKKSTPFQWNISQNYCHSRATTSWTLQILVFRYWCLRTGTTAQAVPPRVIPRSGTTNICRHESTQLDQCLRTDRACPRRTSLGSKVGIDRA